jgi:tRNA threonylcarbamoyladenosine biosynthesis protein TsaE
MYRLRSSDDLWGIGWDDYLDRNGVCAVEWSESVADAMEDAIFITIEKIGDESRRITIEGGENLAALSL